MSHVALITPTHVVIYDRRSPAGQRYQIVCCATDDLVARVATKKQAQAWITNPTTESCSDMSKSLYPESADPATVALLDDPAQFAQSLIDASELRSMLPEGLPDDLAEAYLVQLEVIVAMEARSLDVEVPMFANATDPVTHRPTIFGPGCIAAAAQVQVGSRRVPVSSLSESISRRRLVEAACTPFRDHLLDRFKLNGTNVYTNIPQIDVTVDEDAPLTYRNAVVGLHFDGNDVPGALLFAARLHEDSPLRAKGLVGFVAVLFDPGTFEASDGGQVVDWGWSDPSCWERGGIVTYLDGSGWERTLDDFARYLRARAITRALDVEARRALAAGREQPEFPDEAQLVTERPLRNLPDADVQPF